MANYVDLTTRFVYELQTVFGDFNSLANNDAFLEENGWEDGTVGAFFQAAAPVGWTKITTADARAVRIVSGAGGGVGGSQDPATTITLAHTHTVANQAAHDHLLEDHLAYLAVAGSDRSNGVSVVPVVEIPSASPPHPANAITDGAGSSANQYVEKKNELPLYNGPYTTGSGGAHDHGGATDSQLSNVSLAYVNVIFCSKNSSTGYTDLTEVFVHNTRHVFDYMDQLAHNDDYNYNRRTPAGTVSLFGSATAPVGWTKLATQDGKMLRVVSGTGGGSGGSADPATTITLAHTHGDLTSGGGHTHSIPAHRHKLADEDTLFLVPGSGIGSTGGQLREWGGALTSGRTVHLAYTAADGSGTSTSDGAHQHALGSSLANVSLAYFNVIQASKDSGGEPFAYTDMTTFFVDQALLAWQEMQTMAYNDAYLKYHTMPANAVSFFFQAAAPLNWTKLTTQNDVLARIVSGSGGGTGGGSSPLSSSLLLAHTHSIDTKVHDHSFDHTHTLDTGTLGSTSSSVFITNTRIFGEPGAALYRSQNGGGGDFSRGPVTDTVTLDTDEESHNHGAATGSALSNLTLAYADVIMCSKD